jgi:hypothetical protein
MQRLLQRLLHDSVAGVLHSLSVSRKPDAVIDIAAPLFTHHV